MPEAELKPAFEWTCDACGRWQYVSANPMVIKDSRGVDDCFPVMPKSVSCWDCHATFETTKEKGDDP